MRKNHCQSLIADTWLEQLRPTTCVKEAQQIEQGFTEGLRPSLLQSSSMTDSMSEEFQHSLIAPKLAIHSRCSQAYIQFLELTTVAHSLTHRRKAEQSAQQIFAQVKEGKDLCWRS